jgi:hypothetical protein
VPSSGKTFRFCTLSTLFSGLFQGKRRRYERTSNKSKARDSGPVKKKSGSITNGPMCATRGIHSSLKRIANNRIFKRTNSLFWAIHTGNATSLAGDTLGKLTLITRWRSKSLSKRMAPARSINSETDHPRPNTHLGGQMGSHLATGLVQCSSSGSLSSAEPLQKVLDAG